MPGLTNILEQNGIDIRSFTFLSGEGSERIYSLTVPGAEAIDQWRKLRGLVEETGYWPVILGDKKQLELQLETIKQNSNWAINGIIEKNQEINAINWLDKTFNKPFKIHPHYAYPHEDWPSDTEPNQEFSLHLDPLTQEPFDIVYLGLLPTINSWGVPAFLKFGAWNACPPSEVHVSILKYWHELFGAEIVGTFRDVIELQVLKPPTNKIQAIRLAEEQSAYCPDIVFQGAGTIEALAACLIGSTVWSFWWD